MFREVIERIESTVKSLFPADGPAVTVGGTGTGRNSEIWIGAMPEAVEFSDRSTSRPTMGRAEGRYSVRFEVPISMYAKMRGMGESTATVLGWYERVASAIAADKTLGGLCVHAEPFFSTAGTGRDGDRALYVAAIDGGVRVRAEIDPINDLSKE